MTGPSTRLDRRGVLAGLAGVVAALAGCTTETDGTAPDERDGPLDTPDATPSDAETTATAGTEATGVAEYLADVGNYDGTVVDETGADEVTVRVGAAGNGGNFAFAPPAVRVDPGTTVVWEWTGAGGNHNVVAESGAFESSLSGEASHTFEQTIEEGVVKYYCTPHRGLGMKGVVVVG